LHGVSTLALSTLAPRTVAPRTVAPRTLAPSTTGTWHPGIARGVRFRARTVRCRTLQNR